MKTRIVIGGIMAAIITFQATAQRAESDDMYFKSKDREKLKVERTNLLYSANEKMDKDYKAFKEKHFEAEEQMARVNPTDSYSSRTINPEYIARSNSEQASEVEQNYYLEGYAPANTYDSYSGGNYSNNNNWNNYNTGYYGSNYGNQFYSPYYGYNDPFRSSYYGYGSGSPYGFYNSPYCSPFSYGNGWNLSVGYSWGNPYNSYYSPYYSNWGYPTYYSNNGGNYNEASRTNYGKRPSRHSAIVTPTQRSAQRVSSANNSSPNGRSRQSADEYYVKPSRRTSVSENSAPEYSRGYYTRPTPTDRSTRARETNNNARESRSTYSAPSRSVGSSPARSSGGSSSPRPSRGRDN